MIGTLEKDGTAIATLADDGTWLCGDKAALAVLNARFGRDQYSPADGPFGPALLHDAAEFFGAEVVGLEENFPFDEDAVY